MLKIELAEGISSLPRAEWDAMVGAGSPFLEWDWLASLEESGCVGDGTGWQSQPLVAREDGRLVAACPLYVKGNSEGEFVFDWGWADAAQRAGIAYYPKLLVGVPFTPVTGSRFLVAEETSRELWEPRLAGALRELVTANDISGVHVNFCLEDQLPALDGAGFMQRTGIQYHWQNDGYENFDDYLSRFRSKRRNQIKREMREVAQQGVTIESLSGDEIGDDLIEPMYRFYLSTIENRFYGRQYLDIRFFELARERFRRNLVFIVAKRDGRPIGGTFNVAKGDALYGRYWGCTEEVRFLHFNVCYYAAVAYCIEHGLQRFEPGAGGDYKQLRGFDATATWSAHYIADPRLAHAISRFLKDERAEAARTIDWMLEESALKTPTKPEPK